jgi:hypothetical protein
VTKFLLTLSRTVPSPCLNTISGKTECISLVNNLMFYTAESCSFWKKRERKSSICSYFVNDFRGIKQRNVSLAINNWERFLCLPGCLDILMKAENVILQFCKCSSDSSDVSRLAIFFRFKLTCVLQALFSVCKHISNDLQKYRQSCKYSHKLINY